MTAYTPLRAVKAMNGFKIVAESDLLARDTFAFVRDDATEAEARAHLFAASPRLLLALAGLLNAIIEQDDGGPGVSLEQMQEAISAVAQAYMQPENLDPPGGTLIQ